MHALQRISSLALVALAALAAPACGVEYASEGGGDGGGDEVPANVRVAFEQSCGQQNCHDANGTSAGLSLVGNAIGASIGSAGNQRSDLPLIEIGNVGGSYLALKMLPEAQVAAYGESIVGSRMPIGGGSAQDQENMALILGWIAGADLSMTEAEADGAGEQGWAAPLEPPPDLPAEE